MERTFNYKVNEFVFSSKPALIIPLFCLVSLFLIGGLTNLQVLNLYFGEQGPVDNIIVFIYAACLFFLGSANLKSNIKYFISTIIILVIASELDLLDLFGERSILSIGFYMDKSIPKLLKIVAAPIFLISLFIILFNLPTKKQLIKAIQFRPSYLYSFITALIILSCSGFIEEGPILIQKFSSITFTSETMAWSELIGDTLELSVPLLILVALIQVNRDNTNLPKTTNTSVELTSDNKIISGKFTNLSLNKILTYTLIIGLLAVVFYTLFPKTDIWFAEYFYKGNRHFSFQSPSLGNEVRHLLMEGYGYTILISLISVIYCFYKRDTFFGKNLQQMLFLFACLTIGPGLVSNLIFKSHWGRARPVHIEEFGGIKKFTPPLVLSQNCKRNCSFFSGESSNYFAMFFGLALISTTYRRNFLLAGIGAGLFAGYIRMGAGGHFLSDIIFSGIFMSLTCLFLAWLILHKSQFAKKIKVHSTNYD
ncbi:MAG: phosphatase PAP2 family protein [Rhodomicrobiaceae bacterium]